MTENKSVYRKVVDEKSQGSDNLKRQTTIDLSPWKFDEDKEKGIPARSGYTCQIRVLKLGNKPKTSFININPFDRAVRQALKEMYEQADKLEGKAK